MHREKKAIKIASAAPILVRIIWDGSLTRPIAHVRDYQSSMCTFIDISVSAENIKYDFSVLLCFICFIPLVFCFVIFVFVFCFLVIRFWHLLYENS